MTAFVLATGCAHPAIEWRLDNLERIGGHPVRVEGEPRVITDGGITAVSFGGLKDALWIDADPLAGMEEFTLEILFRPVAGGLPEQRFLHIQEQGSDDRMMVETRLDGLNWYLDSYVLRDGQSVPIIDPAKRHPLGQWYRLAVIYDGKTFSHYVDGVLQGSAPVKLRPMRGARASIGVRQNRLFWFKGEIAWLRATPKALKPEEFAKGD